MNINIFFLLIIAVLFGVYFGFKPLDIALKKQEQLPLVELSNFTLYEVDRVKLRTQLTAKDAKKFEDRYEIQNIDYTDNKKDFLVNIQAQKAIYKDNNIFLNGDISFVREDGFTFHTQSAKYEKKDDLLTIKGKFFAKNKDSNMSGENLLYKINDEVVESKNIKIVYDLKESL